MVQSRALLTCNHFHSGLALTLGLHLLGSSRSSRHRSPGVLLPDPPGHPFVGQDQKLPLAHFGVDIVGDSAALRRRALQQLADLVLHLGARAAERVQQVGLEEAEGQTMDADLDQPSSTSGLSESATTPALATL